MKSALHPSILIRDWHISYRPNEPISIDINLLVDNNNINCGPEEFIKNLFSFNRPKYFDEIKEAVNNNDILRIKFLLDEMEKEFKC